MKKLIIAAAAASLLASPFAIVPASAAPQRREVTKVHTGPHGRTVVTKRVVTPARPQWRKWNKGHQAWWTIPFVTAIGKAYEKAYLKARDPAMREKARRFALAYDADRVYAEHWEPVLKELGVIQPAGGRR